MEENDNATFIYFKIEYLNMIVKVASLEFTHKQNTVILFAYLNNTILYRVS